MENISTFFSLFVLFIDKGWAAEFLTVAILHGLAVISPGPDFAIVIKQSVSKGRQIGRITALGVGTAILIHVAYSLLGISLLVKNSETLFALMKYVAAAYLIYIGLSAIRSKAGQGQAMEETVLVKFDEAAIGGAALGSRDFWSSYRTGFLTNGLNPKATLFFFSLFTVVIDPETPLLVQLGYGVYMAIATGLWFFIVATVFGHKKVRLKFERMGHWFDRIMGAALIALGLKIATANL